MTAIFPDADGFVQNQRYRPHDLSVEQLEAFSEVVAAISVLSDDWKAVQAWVRLGRVVNTTDGEEVAETTEAVVLTVEAVNPHGARKLFTSEDYPEFTIPGTGAGAGAIAFFKHFSGEDERV